MSPSSISERLSSLFEPRETKATGVRGVLNRYPALVGAGAVLVVLCCLFFNFHQGTAAVQAYYTVDDGATFFADTAHVPPFGVSGRDAVGAMVYSCDGGKTRFVGYLYRYAPEARARIEERLKEHRVGPPLGMEVKRPGAGNWVSVGNHGHPDGAEDSASITDVKCPEGGVPSIINPP